MLAQALEDHSPGGGIDTHGKGLSREQHLDEASAEQHLHHFLHDRQQACMPLQKITPGGLARPCQHETVTMFASLL